MCGEVAPTRQHWTWECQQEQQRQLGQRVRAIPARQLHKNYMEKSLLVRAVKLPNKPEYGSVKTLSSLAQAMREEADEEGIVLAATDGGSIEKQRAAGYGVAIAKRPVVAAESVVVAAGLQNGLQQDGPLGSSAAPTAAASAAKADGRQIHGPPQGSDPVEYYKQRLGHTRIFLKTDNGPAVQALVARCI